METLNSREGKLRVTVASEDNLISEGTSVVIETIIDNSKNIFVLVTSMKTQVRLPFCGTDIDWLLGEKS